MTPADIAAAVQAIAQRCDASACPLTEAQKQLLRQVLFEQFQRFLSGAGSGIEQGSADDQANNPLEQLTSTERRTLLKFIREQDREGQSWKTMLLNDWLQGRDSGPVQFIRDRFGIAWLEQVQATHIAAYDTWDNETLQLKVGDRIEVSNGLWEWVQENGPCPREWFACTVVAIREPLEDTATSDHVGQDNPSQLRSTSCVVRFDSGAEYEIQGIYDWNRPNWRWMTSDAS